MADVFVSYKAEDRRRVEPLVKALQGDGLTVWWDEDIAAGDEWSETIERHLDSARSVVVIWSKRSIGREGRFVREEARRAQRRDCYIPILLDAVEPPLGFAENQAISLRAWRGSHSDPRYQAVLAAIRRHALSGMAVTAPPLRGGTNRRAVIAGGALVTFAAAGVGAWELFKVGRASASDSIAVLPFANLSGDPNQAYFSDGVAEEIRSALTRLPHLKVIGRSSSEAVRNEDAESAAKKLGVVDILTGSVRRTQSTIRISAELIDGKTGVDKWSQDYDRSPGDAIKIQTDIAANVAEALRIALGTAGGRGLTVGGTNNVDAQNLILQADALLLNIFNEKRARRGLELIDSAIALDPNYAGAYARRGVLLSTVSMFFSHGPDEAKAGFSQALESANKAIGLAPRLNWAHLALAQVSVGQLQLRPAWTEYNQALRLGPSYANTMRLYARFLAQIGREKQALELADRAIAVDPLSAESYAFRIGALYRARRYADAEQTARELIVRSPGLFHPHTEYIYCLVMLGKLAAARQMLAQAPANDPSRLSGEGILSARSGDRNGARIAIQKLQGLIGGNASYSVAQIHAQVGEPAESFAALDGAFENTNWALIDLLTDPFMDPIRDDPRFKAALLRVAYP